MAEELRAKWNILLGMFNAKDGVDLEDVHYMMHQYWRAFLDAGYDAKQVAVMMSHRDRWENYDELVARGVDIDVLNLGFDVKFIKAHWDEFVARGATPDELAKTCYLTIEAESEIIELTKRGVSAEVIFNLAGEWFYFMREYQHGDMAGLMREIFSRQKLSEDDLKSYIDRYICDSLLEDIVEKHPEEWKKIGIDPNDYFDDFVESWVYQYGDYFLMYYPLSDLPASITLERFINSFPMQEILELIDYNLLSFIEYEYEPAGGDVDFLAKKFVKEIGYPSDFKEARAMLDIASFGVKEIDVKKLCDTIDPDEWNQRERLYFAEKLRNIGTDTQLVSKFLS